MSDEHFEIFTERFGNATTHIFTPATELERWHLTLPPALLEYWAAEG
jgi:hypothetical protein